MDRLRLIVREPAQIIDLIETGLMLLVALGLSLSNDQIGYIGAALFAVAGVLKALTTSPWPVNVFTDAARAIAVLAVAFGLDWDAQTVTVLVTFIGTIVTTMNTLRTTPNFDPVVARGGAGAGPVTGRAGEAEDGWAALEVLGAVIALVGLVLLVLTLTVKSVTISPLICIVLLVIGIVMVAVDRARGRARY